MSTAELLDPRGCICDTTDRASCGGWRQFATVTKSCSCACHAALETAPATAPLVSAADAQRLHLARTVVALHALIKGRP